MPEKAPETECGREPAEFASHGGDGAGIACGEGVPKWEDEQCRAQEHSTKEEIMG